MTNESKYIKIEDLERIRNMLKAIRKFFSVIFILIIVFAVGVVGISYLVTKDQEPNIIYKIQDYDMSVNTIKADEIQDFEADCIIVLGAGIYADGTPTPILKDRLDTALKLYWAGVCDRILVTGDNGQEEYNEVKCMYDYLKNRNVPKDAIFTDHAGFSTYDSMYRAQSIFEIKKAIVVTQSYHLYRALYIGNNLGYQCVGVASDQNRYSGQLFRSAREILARDKDVLKTLVKMKPKYDGDAIPISGQANGAE